KAEKKDNRVIPNGPIPEALPPVDLDLKVRCGQVEAGKISLGDVALGIKLENGRLRIDPLSTGLAGGKVHGTLVLDHSEQPPRTNLDLVGSGVELGQLLEPFGKKQWGAGRMALRAQLAGSGADLRSLLAAGSGRLAVTMDKGQLGAVVIEALGQDLAQAL